jgi:RNA polymerase sigma-70 factor (ECF subfamily)
MTAEELKQILKKAQNGDREAFALIYEHFSDKIYRFIYFRVGHKEIAEDVLSDTFVKSWQKINQINSPEALAGWLYQIARNNIIDYYRIKKDTVSLEDVAETLQDLVSPVDTINASLQQKRILDVLNQLTSEQQEVIKYRFFEDLSNEEIAYVMGKTIGAIRVIQHRAITKLKELLNNK